ncbi:uncharacterized protein AMSG_04344 [Thecamonas trahens ATCC 50062]|uniref:Ska2 N-terminal domain-containing protein n=1 Tax=Thecamonas trahens ATCC 50062 TaxID=461836 RepID=A0A0L0D6Z5_THETB|nr:hypothetical protein AMSG_04344 [Thecamonas trahens ATCC 50062]KNC48114.1 hypothetical protein AMSG_04344 [Thecamonas trahens ATCC 50062]|eukprot:XP_013758687.1 hypothetical protein AMSG_04344 [Thecamonas trahens ATCC 50062]
MALSQKFEPVLADLAYVEEKLVEEFGTSTTPAELLARLSAVEEAVAGLRERHAAVVAAKDEFYREAAKTVAGGASRLLDVTNTPGTRAAHLAGKAALATFEASKKEWHAAVGTSPAALARGAGKVAVPSAAEALALTELEVGAGQAMMAGEADEADAVGNNEDELETEVAREAARWFVPLVRGRISVDAVNAVYRTVYDTFQAEPRRKPMGVKEMVSMGLSVTGASGKAKLNVLRSLKLIEMSSAGVVLARPLHKRLPRRR